MIRLSQMNVQWVASSELVVASCSCAELGKCRIPYLLNKLFATNLVLWLTLDLDNSVLDNQPFRQPWLAALILVISWTIVFSVAHYFLDILYRTWECLFLYCLCIWGTRLRKYRKPHTNKIFQKFSGVQFKLTRKHRKSTYT